MNQASNETCQTCGQQIPDGYVPVQDARAIIRAFIAHDNEENEWREHGAVHWRRGDDPDGQEIPGILGKVKKVAETGGMDQGSYASVVYEIAAPSGSRYFRIEGQYASHYGTDWDTDTFAEVFPREVPKIEWDVKK